MGWQSKLMNFIKSSKGSHLNWEPMPPYSKLETFGVETVLIKLRRILLNSENAQNYLEY